MTGVTSAKIKQESRKLRALVAEYVTLRHAKRAPAGRLAALRGEIKQALVFLDQNALKLGDDKPTVETLLGPAPGHAGDDSWFYPGGVADETFRLDFQGGAVARKSFEIIHAG